MLDLPNPPNDFTVEKSLSTELLKLSFEERLAIQEEIHGVRCGATEETTELLHQSLLEFDEKVNARKEASLANPEEDDRNLCKFLQNVCRPNAGFVCPFKRLQVSFGAICFGDKN